MESLKPYQKKILNNVFIKLGIELTNGNIIKHVSKVYNYILDGGQYATSTKRDYLIILCKVLEYLKQPKLRDYIYNNNVKPLAEQHTKEEYKQVLDESEKLNYIKYDELFKKVQSLIDVYNDKRTKKNIIRLLILSLYVLQPPLRNDYYNMKIIYNDIQDDRKSNYLLLDKDNIYIIINHDKVINLHGRGEIPILNTTLKTIIKLYMDQYANNNIYLFENKDGTPYKKHQIQYIINTMFNNKVLNIYNLRSSYITDFYKNNLGLLERSNLADSMRHGAKQAELSYFKNI
jgi:hypothetical protein